MKLNLSTLLLIVTAVACSIGWFSEHRRSQIATAELEIKYAAQKAEFAERTKTLISGSEALATGHVAIDILTRLAPLVPANENDPFDFDTDRDFVDQTAIKVLFNLWQNEKAIQDSMYAIVPPEYHAEVPKDLAIELAKQLLELLEINNTFELIDRVQELYFVDLPFPQDRQKRIDTRSREFKAFDRFVSFAKNSK